MTCKLTQPNSLLFPTDVILNDYRIAFKSRQVSLVGRREVMSGKAKFGIFGDGKEVVQVYTSGTNRWVYMCYLPYAYDSQPARKWPMIIFQPCMSATDGSWSPMQGGIIAAGFQDTCMQRTQCIQFIPINYLPLRIVSL